MVAVIGLFIAFSASAKPLHEGRTTYLDFDKIWYSQIGISRDVSGVFRDGEQLLILGDREPFYASAKFTPQIKSFMDNSVYDLPAYDKHLLPKETMAGIWRSILPFGSDYWLLLNSERMKILAIEKASGSVLAERDVILDLPHPPKDTRGEPIRVELKATRQKFLNLLLKKLDRQEEVAAGMVVLPEAWREKEKSQYLLALHLPDFPVATVSCMKETVGQCQIDRACFVHPDKEFTADALAGIAVNAKRRLLLIGDAANRRLLVFKYHSCYDVRQVGEIVLPKKLKKLANVMIDSEENLWVTTKEPDDFRNGSIFVWQPSEWLN